MHEAITRRKSVLRVLASAFFGALPSHVDIQARSARVYASGMTMLWHGHRERDVRGGWRDTRSDTRRPPGARVGNVVPGQPLQPQGSLRMHPLSILLLGMAMSTDAFAAAVGRGTALRRPQLRDALRAGLIFGVIEGLTPLLGWLLGRAALPYVAAWDHWIAFGLLGLLGLRMVVAGCGRVPPADADDSPRRPSSMRFWALAATGVATSIDAMAVGAGLAFADVNIVVVAVVIGLTTLVMVTAGVQLGSALGRMAGRRAELCGGLVLIAIGAAILYQHLAA